MISQAGMSLPPKTMRQQVASAISVVIQATRLNDGRRKIVSIQEITGMEGEVINMQEIFGFKRTGVEQNGTVRGYFCATGVRPKFAERFEAFGINLPDHIYDPTRRFEAA
jgi:pilus assembly protein CpaF